MIYGIQYMILKQKLIKKQKNKKKEDVNLLQGVCLSKRK